VQFLKLLGEDDAESQKLTGDEAALAKAVDAMVESIKEKQGIVPVQMNPNMVFSTLRLF